MGGILGGKQSTSVQIPGYLNQAGQNAVGLAQDISKIGYVPYSGPDVAALTPMQLSAMQAGNQAASAFGLPTSQVSMPEPTTYAGGVQGYSAFPIYQQAVEQLQAMNPEQYAALTGLLQGGGSQSAPQAGLIGGSGGSRRFGGAGQRPLRQPGRSRGYTSFRDMFDGGGAGASGSTFSGGGILSSVANKRLKPWGSK